MQHRRNTYGFAYRSQPLPSILCCCLWHHETDWNQIASLCFDYPQLPIIIEGTGRKILYDNRMFYQLMEQCDNEFTAERCDVPKAP